MRPTLQMTKTTLIAVGQLTSTANRAHNLALCKDLAHQAKAKGASMLFLPECFSLVGNSWQETVAAGQGLDGPIIKEMAAVAKEEGLWLSLGGFPEKKEIDKEGESGGGGGSKEGGEGGEGQQPKTTDTHTETYTPLGKVYNTHLILNDTGSIQQTYRKIHLFDVNVRNGPVLRESRYTAPGSEPGVVVDSPCGKLGLSTCYDVRFPEVYAALVAKGAEVLLVPSAFTVPTGKAHWELLLRARAVETQCYVIAAAQAGKHNEKRESYGHSLIVDPWGKVLADAGGEASPALITAEIDLEYLHGIREKMPVQKHRRADIFGGAVAGGGGGCGGSSGGSSGGVAKI